MQRSIRNVPDCHFNAVLVHTYFSTSISGSIINIHVNFFALLKLLKLFFMVGYPVHGCNSPLAVVEVVTVVLAAVTVELVVVSISFLATQSQPMIFQPLNTHINPPHSQTWTTVKIGNSFIIRNNAATRAAILRVVQVGTVANSASTGTSKHYAY
jgi:hypothetical protein